MRLDQYLYVNGYVGSRSKAQDAIKAERVAINDKIITKCSFSVLDTMKITVVEPDIAFASRAGYKLFDVLKPFSICLQDRICIDVGASTGGFSDVCLKEGATFVYAVDVGRDQLIGRLKQDSRIKNMENINCRYLTSDMFDERPNFACMDVSFISIKKILPALFSIMSSVEAVVLIKPQFEAGKENLNKHGIVRDEKIHVQVLKDIVAYVETCGYYVHHLCASSILGRDGNKEFVMHIVSENCNTAFSYRNIVHNYKTKR